MRRASIASLLFAFLGEVDATPAPDVRETVEFVVENAEERRVRDLAVQCPHCGRAVAAPASTARGENTLAECDPCDLYFEARIPI